MVSVLASSTVDRGFEPQSDQNKDYAIGMFCFSSNHAVLRSKVNDCWAPDQDNMSEWSDMSIRELVSVS